MRGGYNSDLDGEDGELHVGSTDRAARDYNLRRPGPQAQPHADAGGTHEQGHDIPHVTPPGPRSDHTTSGSDQRRGPSRHYFHPAAPPMPQSAPTVQSGRFYLTKRQKLRENESRLKDLDLPGCKDRFSNMQRSVTEPIQTARTRYQGYDDLQW